MLGQKHAEGGDGIDFSQLVQDLCLFLWTNKVIYGFVDREKFLDQTDNRQMSKMDL